MGSYQPPSACRQPDTVEPQIQEAPKRSILTRKPVSSQKFDRKTVPTQPTSNNPQPQNEFPVLAGGGPSEKEVRAAVKREQADVGKATLISKPRPGLTLEPLVPANLENSPPLFSPTRTDTSISAASSTTAYSYGSPISPSSESFQPSLSARSTGTMDSVSSQSSASSQWKKRYEDARHFAGGLISRPYESTKHFTIIRHSHGLVFYQGSSTSLAISIFSDAPLPPDHTLWLQGKGWTGKTGMRVKALLRRNDSWLNVTPTVAVGAEQVNPTDERAWQRDLQKFQKKGPSKIRDRHRLRQTAIVRIPAAAGDGYFQILLCPGDSKKILCPSPAFRVLSTSTSPSSIKGASLSTLPFELGAMLLVKHTTGAVSTIASPVQQYMPSWWTKQAVSTSYEISGLENKVNLTAADAQKQYEQDLYESLDVAEKQEIALEDGPTAPYPIHFVAACYPTAKEADDFNLPHTYLSLPENISPRLHGYYFAWVRNLPKQDKGESLSGETLWAQAIISATLADTSLSSTGNLAHSAKKNFTLQIIEEFETPPNEQERIEIQVMGFIRPDEPVQRAKMEHGLQVGEEAAAEASMLVEANDISAAQKSLNHPSWAPVATEREIAQEKKAGRLDKLKKGYATKRMAAQKQIDRVPFDKAGIRLPKEWMKDRNAVVNGFFITR